MFIGHSKGYSLEEWRLFTKNDFNKINLDIKKTCENITENDLIDFNSWLKYKECILNLFN